MTKQCQQCKTDFEITPDDEAFYQKIDVPPPTWCPECRALRRFIWRGEHALFKRKSDFSGELIFSGFSPESPVKVYENDIYYSDKWDPMEFGREYDFSKPFFEQLMELFRNVPLPARSTAQVVESDYCNWVTATKNCYLLFNTTGAEDSAYGNAINYSRDCFDNSHLNKCELSYEGFWLSQCNKAYFSSQCENSTDIYFCKNLYGCSNCFGCVNLRNKKYHIWNKAYSEEEYFKKIKEFDLTSRKSLIELKNKAHEFHLKFPNKFIEGVKNADVSGEYISNSKNVHNSYLIKEGENLKYCQYLAVPPNKDCYDHTVFGNNNELTYECAICGLGVSNSKFCWWCWPDVRNLEYCLSCGLSSDLFGCVSLRNKKYCILNKQYSKEEYEELVPKIIQHMNEMPYIDAPGNVYKYGEFFPIDMSPFAYNETIAEEHWPITKEDANRRGYVWRDSGERNYKITIEAKDLPDTSDNIPDSISNEIIGCEHSGGCNHQCMTAFKIIPQELLFYRKMNLPLPNLCPNCRRSERLSKRNTLKSFRRTCQCNRQTTGNESAINKTQQNTYKNISAHSHGHVACQNEFETSYAPERPEIVYCTECYQAEIG